MVFDTDTPLQSEGKNLPANCCALWICASFGAIQLLSHEVMLVSGRMILKHSKDAISEFFVEGSRLKTEGVEECIGAASLDRIKFRTLHQFPPKAMPSRRRGHGKRSDV
jgi:hypothetical protein